MAASSGLGAAFPFGTRAGFSVALRGILPPVCAGGACGMLRRIVAVGVGWPLHSAVGRGVPEFLRWSRSAARSASGAGILSTAVRMRPLRRSFDASGCHGAEFAYAVCNSMAGRMQRQPVQEVGVNVWLYRPVP